MKVSSRRGSRALLVAVVALITSFSLAPAAQGSGRFRLAAVPEASGPPVNVSKALLKRERAALSRGESRMVSVIVRLEDEPLASYQGSIPGLAATSPRATGAARLDARSGDSQQYTRYLAERQVGVISRLQSTVPTARVIHRYTTVLNGMSILVPEDSISTVASIPGVRAVYEDRLLQLTTEVSPQFIGAPTVWNKLGGQGSAGEGVIIGVLDTGIWPEHPSFSDPDPIGKPYAAPPPPLSGTRACEFSGGPNPGPAFTCNNKLIGADRFMATYDAVVGLLPDEYTTARDDNGHGTHTSSTAAGSQGVSASIFGRSFGTVSGVAPRAHVIMYKVCGDQGCFTSDSAAAVQEAVQDGVDVINFSISGGSNPYADAVSLAFLDAYNAGVFVAASAGNSGPGADTVGHREPWTMTVGASTTDRQFRGTVRLSASGGATLALDGASVTPALSSPAPVYVPPADVLCLSPLAPGSVTGVVVVCQRGGNGRVEKSFNVAQGGAAGMILYNPSLQGIGSDNHFIPTVHLESGEGSALLSFLGSQAGVTATLSAGTAAPYQGDVMAPFSSRGGSGQALGVSKPDVTAPGVQTLAGHTPTPATIVGGLPGQLFQAIQGTSMASPHVAGAAALLRALRPSWTPGQVKSALMTTATGAVVKHDGFTPADPFDHGSGRIDLTRAGDPGILIDETGANYVALQSHLWDANYPSVYVPALLGKLTVQRTLKSTRNVSRSWKTFVTSPPDLKIQVPANVAVPKTGTKVLNIKLNGSGIPLGQVRHAVLELRHPQESTIRIPITVVRGTPFAMPLTKECTPSTVQLKEQVHCTITITNTSFEPADVSMTDKVPAKLKLVNGSVVNAIKVGANKVVFSGPVAPAEPPGISIAPGPSIAGYLPLAGFGVPPIAGVGDETMVNFNTPGFLYGTEVYSRVGISSNGYLVIGGGDSADQSYINTNLPHAARPNNVIAPYWTDLNPSAGGALRITTLTDGTDTWLVVEWGDVPEYGIGSNRHSFQVWIGLNTDANPGEDVSIAYGPNGGNGADGFLTVGAENRFGNRGGTVYFNGAGSLPVQGTALRVTSAPGGPGETRVITYSATGKAKGNWQNCAQMTSKAFFGTQKACVKGKVTK